MKKLLFYIFAVIIFSKNAWAQSPRLCLYEEFTSETCPPDASTNPGLKIKLDSMVAKIVSIKWHFPIPAVPNATWSPYKANKAENDWRYQGTGFPGYGYPGQFTPTAGISNGIFTSPTGMIDGQHQWNFGTNSDHPASLTYSTINTAQAIMSPFTIGMLRSWDATYSSVTVTISITASQNYTATGTLVYRLVMVAKCISCSTITNL